MADTNWEDEQYEKVNEYIKGLSWSADWDKDVITLVGGNIRGFFGAFVIPLIRTVEAEALNIERKRIIKLIKTESDKPYGKGGEIGIYYQGQMDFAKRIIEIIQKGVKET